MRLRATTILAALGLSLLFASSAMAAPVLELSAQRDVATVPRNDEYLSYSVKVKNTGDVPTAGTTTVTVALPAGMKMWQGSGSGWSCNAATSSCTSSAAIAPTAEFPALKLELWIIPAQVAETVNIAFGASGGGASGEGTTADGFTFAPAIPFGLTSFTAKAEDDLGADYALAGGHPFSATTTFEPTKRRYPFGERRQAEDLRDLFAELPPGFLGNPTAATTQCTVREVRELICPPAAAVGGAALDLFDGIIKTPVYKVIPEEGFAAAFAFAPHSISKLTVVIRAKVRSNGDYGVSAVAPLAPQSPQVVKAEFVTLCGFGVKMSDQAGGPGSPPVLGKRAVFDGCFQPSEAGAAEIPFLTNPTRCEGPPPVTRARIDSWQDIGALDPEGFPDISDPAWKSYEAVAPPNSGCAALNEAWVDPATGPSFGFQPATQEAAAPAAYTAELEIPQHGLLGRDPDGTLNPDAQAAAHLKDTTVVLPRGLALNPAAAHGLDTCSLAEAGYVGSGFGSPNPVRFNTISAGCPADSKVGNVEVKSPPLDKVLRGSIYLADQGQNPFGSDFAVYLVIDDEETGIKATLAGEVRPDNDAEGQITAVFRNNPQVPVEHLEVSFFDGPHASLANPDVCATYTTRAELTPWSALDPEHPLPSETAISLDPVAIDRGPGGGSCATTKAERPLAPGFSAGVTTPHAGAHSPFTLRLTRPDGNQEIEKVSVTTPPGFAATLKGLKLCSQAGIDRAKGRTATGEGAVELTDPSCPASSQVGTTTIGAGAGPDPFYVKTGKVYLSGPYKGAPLSFTFIVPAVAGPFDLGVQVVRTALNVNPRTAQITAVSDSIPRILRGVPLSIRDIRVDVDRPGFTLNPTNCEVMAIGARVEGASGAVANLQERFQVGGCEALRFKPNLKLQLHGSPKRAKYQRLVATVTAAPGEANIARTAVTFPHSIFLAQEHIRTICTRVQFAAEACPKGSIYGRATAFTPLLEEPLSGPVYLRSSDNVLPDLVAALRGPDSMPIEVELVGRTDSKNQGIRNTFDIIPDAPVSTFTLRMFGGEKSLLVNSRNLCKGPKQRATVRFRAQNGKRRDFRPVVGNDCAKKKQGPRKK